MIIQVKPRPTQDAIAKRWRELDPDYRPDGPLRQAILDQLGAEFGMCPRNIRFHIEGALLDEYHHKQRLLGR
jgi:hypothetical protein